MPETAAQRKWRLNNKNTEYKEKQVIYMREYRKKNKEKMQELGRNWYQKNRETCIESMRQRALNEPWWKLYHDAKARSNKNNIPFDLTLEYVKSIWPIDNKCPVLKIPLVKASRPEKGRNSSPSLDRIIPELGYTRGNVIVISTKANRIKNNATAQEIQAVANYFLKLTKVCC